MAKKKVKAVVPFFDNVLVRRLPEETVSEGGIFIPDTSKEKPAQGVVVAVGDGRFQHGVFVPTTTQVDMVVLFGKYAGVEVRINNEDVLLLKEDELLGEVRN